MLDPNKIQSIAESYSAQKLFAALVWQRRFNQFNGEEVIADLSNHPELWASFIFTKPIFAPVGTPAARRGGFLSHRPVTRLNNLSCPTPAPRSPQVFLKITGCPTAIFPRRSITFAAATSRSRVTLQY